MTSVETNSYPRLVYNFINDGTELAEVPADGMTLAGHVLQDNLINRDLSHIHQVSAAYHCNITHLDPCRLLQSLVDPLRDELDALVSTDLTARGARVDVEHGQAELLAPLQLLDQQPDALLAFLDLWWV